MAGPVQEQESAATADLAGHEDGRGEGWVVTAATDPARSGDGREEVDRTGAVHHPGKS